jgi:hypothetical protein
MLRRSGRTGFPGGVVYPLFQIIPRHAKVAYQPGLLS